MSQPASAPGTTTPLDRGVTADTQEVRLATTMTGGVSLAVWMGGVAREIDLLVQASMSRRAESRPTNGGSGGPAQPSAPDVGAQNLYAQLIDLLDVVVEVDVLSGTSAGGINAAMLAYARANNGNLSTLREIWLELGALLDLLREPTDAIVPSLLYGDGWLFRQMCDKLTDIAPIPPQGKRPSTTLYITTTLLTGESSRFTDAMGTLVQDNNQRGLFTFTEDDLAPNRTGDAEQTITHALSLAARSTSSFPGAFEPSFVPFDKQTGPVGNTPSRPAMAQYANITRNHWVVDGGVLNNQPLDVLLDRIFDRRAQRPVRRVLLFVVPTAGPSPDLVAAAPADDVGKPYALLDGLLEVVSAATNQSISASLRDIVAHNNRVTARADLRKQLAAMAIRMRSERLLTPSLLGDYCLSESDREARRLVSATMRQLSTWSPQTALQKVGIPAEWQPLLARGTAESTCRSEIRNTLMRRWLNLDPKADLEPTTLPAGSVEFARFGRGAYDNAKSIALAVTRLAYAATTEQIERQGLAQLLKNIHSAAVQPDRKRPAELAKEVFEAAIPAPGQAVRPFPEAARDLAHTWINETSVESTAWDALAAALHQQAGLLIETAGRAADDVLSTYVDYLGLADPGSDAESVAIRLFDLATAERALLPADAPQFQPVELVQLSSDTRGLLTPNRSTAVSKLTGLQFHNFGAFYKKSWRANDWMWGRLDAAGWLVHVLLDPRRLLVITQTVPQGERAAWLLAKLATFADYQPADAEGVSTPDMRAEELSFLDADKNDRIVPRSVPNTSMWLASAWQHLITVDELPKLARVIVGEPEAGKSAGPVDRSPATSMNWANDVLRANTDRLDYLLTTCPVPKETFESDMGSPLMVRTISKAAATTTAAVSSVPQVPGPVRPAVTTAHTIALGGYRVANRAKALPRNLIIVGFVLLALGVFAATQSAALFGIAGLAIAGIGGYLVTFGAWQLSGRLLAALVAVTITGAVAALAFPAVRLGLFGTSESDSGFIGQHVYLLGTDWWRPLAVVGVLVLVIVLVSAAFSRGRPTKRPVAERSRRQEPLESRSTSSGETGRRAAKVRS